MKSLDAALLTETNRNDEGTHERIFNHPIPGQVDYDIGKEK